MGKFFYFSFQISRNLYKMWCLTSDYSEWWFFFFKKYRHLITFVITGARSRILRQASGRLEYQQVWLSTLHTYGQQPYRVIISYWSATIFRQIIVFVFKNFHDLLFWEWLLSRPIHQQRSTNCTTHKYRIKHLMMYANEPKMKIEKDV